jgi:hypothetical protein
MKPKKFYKKFRPRRASLSSAIVPDDSGIRSPVLRYGLKRFLRPHAWSRLALLATIFRFGGSSGGALPLLYTLNDGINVQKERLERIFSGNGRETDCVRENL